MAIFPKYHSMAKIPIRFYALANEVRKNCNVIQVNRLSDGNFYITKCWVKNYILHKNEDKSKGRINSHKIELEIELRSILIQFSSRAIIRIGMPSATFLRISLRRAGVLSFRCPGRSLHIS